MNNLKLLSIFIILLAGCAKDDVFVQLKGDIDEENNDGRIVVSAIYDDNETTKAHWEDVNFEGGALFKWDATTSTSADMVMAIIGNDGGFAQWGSKDFSLVFVTPDNSNAKMATLTTTLSLDIDHLTDSNKVYAFSPIDTNLTNNGTFAFKKGSEIIVDMNMPNSFLQSTKGKLEELKDYSYLYSVSNVENLKNKTNTSFEAVPALFRYNIINKSSVDVEVDSISFVVTESGSNTPKKLFPNKLNLVIGSNGLNLREPDYKHDYYSCVSAKITEGVVKKGETNCYYSYVLPTVNKNSFDGCDFKVVVYTKDNQRFVVNKDKIDISIKTAEKRFRPGFIYTFNIDVSGESKYDYFKEVVKEQSFTKDEIVNSLSSEFGITVNPFMMDIIKGLFNDITVVSIKYNTLGVNGLPVVASGVIAYPKGKTNIDTLVSIQHGTLNISEAPSKKMLGYEILPSAKGKVVVMADYLGYGSSQTPDRQHPYLHSKITGVICADMLEAAKEYFKQNNDITLSDNFGVNLIGYSQGGAATVSTLLELEHRKLNNISEVWAGGGPYDLISILEVIKKSKTYINSGYIPYLFRGMTYGDNLDIKNENVYSSKVIDMLKNDNFFAKSDLSTWHSKLGTNVEDIVNPTFLTGTNLNNDQKAIIDALTRNSLTRMSVKPNHTIKMYHSKTDELVPYNCAQSAIDKWGDKVELKELKKGSHAKSGLEFYLTYLGLGSFINFF